MQIIKTTPNEALALGDSFFKSGLFSDIKSAQQAVVKIIAGAEVGISPVAAMSGIHIIQGKITIGAGLMAARVKGFGKYDYKVVEHSENICSIDFYQQGKIIGNSTFTIEDAKKAGTKNLDKFPKNMLFARAMSNGVKWFTPDIYEQPVYVPEEMQQVETIDTKSEVIEPKKIKLNDIQFNKLLERIAAGENLEDKINNELDLNEEQKNILKELYNYISENPGISIDELLKIISK